MNMNIQSLCHTEEISICAEIRLPRKKSVLEALQDVLPGGQPLLTQEGK